MKKNKGFTLVEMVIAGGISAAVVLYAVTYFKDKDNETKKLQSALEDTLDSLSFEQRIRKDMSETKYSFNTLTLKDDTNKVFFEYLSEGKCVFNCSRKLTINAVNKKQMYFIIKDNSQAVEQVFSPVNAYNFTGGMSTNNNNLSFVSLNKDNVLKSKKFTPWEISTDIKSRLILAYSPVLVYPPNTVYGTVPGKMIKYMGWLNGGNLQGKLITEKINTSAGTIFDDVDPRYNDKITSEDAMLKRLPYTSGMGVFVIVAPVKVIRYRIASQLVNGKTVNSLYRDELKEGSKYTQVVFAADVDQVTFSRETISSGAVDIAIKFTKK
jgi:type II secretory pathway pseudopilin PulG